MMNEMVQYRNLYDELYSILERAGMEERHPLRSAAISDFTGENKQKLSTLNNIAILELREYMQQLITLLSIELPRSLQGKRINTFNDAAAIVSNTRIQIITKMERHPDSAYTDIITNIINCCEEVGVIREF